LDKAEYNRPEFPVETLKSRGTVMDDLKDGGLGVTIQGTDQINLLVVD